MAEELAPAEPVRERRWRSVEWAALAAWVALAGAFVFLTRPGEGPDEPQHLAYVQSLAINHELPEFTPAVRVSASGQIGTPQAQHPPTYYLLIAPIYAAAGGDEVLCYRLARLVSVLLGVGTLLLVRLTARAAFPDEPAVSAFAMVFVATFGTNAYIGGTINNDPLATVFVAGGVYLTVRALQAERPLRPMIVLGVATGAALAVKLTAALLLGPIVVAAIVLGRREADRGWWRAAVLLGAGLAAAAIIAAPWYVRNALVLGEAFPRSDYRPLFMSPLAIVVDTGAMALLLLATVDELLVGLWEPHWYFRGGASWFTDRAMTTYGLALGAEPWLGRLPSVLIALAGCIGVVVRWRSGLSGMQRALVGACVAALGIGVLGVWQQATLQDWHVLDFAGRYTPAMVPALGLLLGLGYHALIPRRFRFRGVLVILVGLLAWDAHTAWLMEVLRVTREHVF